LREVTDAQLGALQTLPFAHDAQRNGNTLSIALEDQDNMTPQVVNTLVGAGASILEVRQQRASLEDVYLDLVGKEDAS